jgi:hypothetical protein
MSTLGPSTQGLCGEKLLPAKLPEKFGESAAKVPPETHKGIAKKRYKSSPGANGSISFNISCILSRA